MISKTKCFNCSNTCVDIICISQFIIFSFCEDFIISINNYIFSFERIDSDCLSCIICTCISYSKNNTLTINIFACISRWIQLSCKMTCLCTGNNLECSFVFALYTTVSWCGFDSKVISTNFCCIFIQSNYIITSFSCRIIWS